MSILSPLEFYLIPQPQETVFAGLVTSTPSDPFVSIAYDTGVTGSFGAPLAGQTVEFVGRGKRRLKTWSGGAAGTIGIDESDDVGPIIQAGDTIRIYNQFRLWPKYPRFVQSGTSVSIFADYDEAYTNQTNQWRPTANAGPIAVEFIEGGQAIVSFVGDRSQAHAAGATITNYLWTARDSSEGTSTSQGTEASPVQFTWTSPGWYLVSLKVTDSNGQSATNYTYVVIIDPASPTGTAFVDFDTFSDSFDFEQGGGTCGFTVRGDASVSNFPEEALIVHAVRGTQTTVTGSWPFRENTLFAGWIMHDTVRQSPDTGEVSFRAATIDSIMKNLSMFPASLTDKTTPVDWAQGKSLTVDRCASFLAKHWSTLDSMTPLIFSGDTRLIRRQDFGPTNLHAMLQNELVGSILGNVVSSHQGALYIEIDYNVQDATERATVTTRKILHKGVWVNDVFVEERADYEWPANQVKMSGIFYPGGEIEDICPLFSEAPGDAMKAYGREHNFDRLILASQDDLNTRSGHMLEKLIQRYPGYREAFLNDGSFAIVPQELFPVVIESGDNDRALSVSINVLPRKINRTYNHENGYYQVGVEFEPETSGRAGVTVDIPCGPPEQKLPDAETPAVPGGIPGQLALMASTTGTSWYMARGIQQTWEKRITGLVDPDQLAFEDIIPDPWSAFKQGYNIESIIVWGSGLGFLVRSDDTGKNWTDRSSYLEPGPLWSGETGSVSITKMLRLNADVFSEDRLYVLGVWRDGSNYRGAIAKATDGFDFTWFNITGSAQVRPLGMSLDQGNGGKLYVTTWENEPTGTIYMRAYNVSDMSLDGRFALGEATIDEIDAQTFYASPFNRRGQVDEVFVFGRMSQPQGFTGTVQVLRNTAAGATGSWSVIEDTWGIDLCGSFGADKDGNYYAVRSGIGCDEGITAFASDTFDTGGILNSANGAIDVVKLSATQHLAVWQEDVSPFEMKACVLDISGDTVTAGAEHAFETGSWTSGNISVAALSSTNVIVLYKGVTNANVNAIILQVSGSTVSSGSLQTVEAFATSTANAVSIVKITSTKAFAIYTETAGAGNDTVGVVLDISGTTITVRTPAQILAYQSQGFVGLGIDTSSLLLLYRNNANDLEGLIISSITTTFTVNSATVLKTKTSIEFNSFKAAALIDTGKYVASYLDRDTDPDELNAFVGTFSGTTVDAPGSDVQLIASNAITGGPVNVVELEDNETVLLAYWESGASKQGVANCGTVSGTTLTLGSGGFTGITTSGGAVGRMALAPVNNNRAMLVYGDENDTADGKARLLGAG